MEIDTYIEQGHGAIARVAGIVEENPIITGAVAGAGILAGVGAVSAVRSIRKRKKKKYVKKKKSNRKRSRRTRKSRHRKRRGRRRSPHTAGKGKDRSTKRIRYTKNGQPYVILRSGKARFIKQSSASRSHKQKGGRY